MIRYIRILKILYYQRHDLWHWYKIYRLLGWNKPLHRAIKSTIDNTIGYCCYYAEEIINVKRI